jgi:hypothetical protein
MPSSPGAVQVSLTVPGRIPRFAAKSAIAAGGKISGPIKVISSVTLLLAFESPPPETLDTLVRLVGAVFATFNFNVMAG